MPPAHFGAQRQNFTRYFLGRGTISFTYRKKPYSIVIENALCFPQSYAAAVTELSDLSSVPKAMVLDYGYLNAVYIWVKNV